jgi:DNA polymerase III subunit epsilon
MKHLIFDTETTGLILHPAAKDELQPHIIEWGGLLVDERGNELEELDLLINPGQAVSAEITKITGITNEDLVGQLPFSAAALIIKALFIAADVLIAHNLPFDAGMMKLDLKRVGMFEDWPWPRINICTVQEHAEEWGKRPKLTELYEHYTGRPLAQTHRALDDVRALKEVCIAAGVLR